MNGLQAEVEQTSGTPEEANRQSVDLMDVVLVLAAGRRLIGFATLAAILVGVILCLLLRANFTATALILPPKDEQSSAAALLGQLGSMAMLGGGGALKTPADMYVGILESRTIADALIDQFHLRDVYKKKNLQDTRVALRTHTEIEAGKDGLIHISVTDHDPNRASDLANGYIEQLYGMNSSLAITEAAQRKVFFDQQLDIEKRALATAEEDLRTTEQRTGLIQLSGQAQIVIQTIAQLRAEIASREVELQAMKTFATEENPDVTRVVQELSTMRQQLAKLESNQKTQSQPGDITLPAGQVAEDSLEYARKLREVKYHDALFDLLSRQYEAARIDEAKSAPIIQVVDKAVPPDKRSGPKRLLLILGFAFVGFVLAAAWVLFIRGLQGMEQHPEYSARVQLLKELLRS